MIWGQKLVIKNIDFLNDFAREKNRKLRWKSIFHSSEGKEKMNEENQ